MVARNRRSFNLEVGVSLQGAMPHDFVLFTLGERKNQKGLIASINENNLVMFTYSQEVNMIALREIGNPVFSDYSLKSGLMWRTIDKWTPEEGVTYDRLYKKLQENGLIPK